MLDAKQAISAPVRWPFEVLADGSLLIVPLAVYVGANRAGCVVLAAAAAVVLLFVAPTLLGVMAFCRFPATRATAPVWAMALNTTALVIVCLLLRQTVGMGRTCASGGLAGLDPRPAAGRLAAGRIARPPGRLGTRLRICRRYRAGGQPGRHVPHVSRTIPTML